jgi:acetoin utilization deacetylase AcuC-like enzyme
MKVAWFDDPRFEAHKNGPGGDHHPERPARHAAVAEALTPLPLELMRPRPATDEELLRVHTRSHLERVAEAARLEAPIDPDTACVHESEDAARHAAGALIQATELVLDDHIKRAFCSVRPPGHHARPSGPMGFCLYSNVAIAAEAALARDDVERVAILDFDVHHGNGTQDAFYERGDVLFASWHQYPHYPGTGARDETGRGAGEGKTVNCPLPAGAGDDELMAAWAETVRPALVEHGPDLILVSAGFDGDGRDPLAGLRYTPAGFARLTAELVKAADELCAGRLVSTLEGGYDLKALAEDARAHVESLS